MFKDLTQSSSVQDFSIDEVAILPAQTEDLFVVPVALNEMVQIVFSYTVHDRTNRCARSGRHQVMANRYTPITSPVPSAHISSDAYGDEPENLILNVTSTGSEVTFAGTNSYTQEEPIFFSARIQVLHIPVIPQPRIRLTITGMTGGDSFNGLGNGVHILEPDLYYRSPLGGAHTVTPITGSTFTFSTGTQCESWRARAAVITTTGDGRLSLGPGQGLTSSRAYLGWNNGTGTQTSVLTYATHTGFARDRVLSGSFVIGAVTFVWEREPSDRDVLWGQY